MRKLIQFLLYRRVVGQDQTPLPVDWGRGEYKIRIRLHPAIMIWTAGAATNIVGIGPQEFNVVITVDDPAVGFFWASPWPDALVVSLTVDGVEQLAGPMHALALGPRPTVELVPRKWWSWMRALTSSVTHADEEDEDDAD